MEATEDGSTLILTKVLDITSFHCPMRQTLPVLNIIEVFMKMAAAMFQNHAEFCAQLCVCWSRQTVLAAIAEEYVSSSSVKKENSEKGGDFESPSESDIDMSGQLSEVFSKSTKYQYDNG